MQKPVGTIYLLKRVELAVRSCVEVALAEFDLTPTQFLMLYRLRDSEHLSAADLAREIGVRPQSIIEIISPLERKRLLKREADPEHQRILRIRLTAAGRKLTSEALQTAARIESELVDELDAKQLAQLQEGLTKLGQRAERHELHPSSLRARTDNPVRGQSMLRPRRGMRTAPRRTREASDGKRRARGNLE
jgi:DNA-binding MarR family transcriptional regulator